MFTPIERVHCDIPGVNMYMKREDLLPFSFGGNKLRIAQEFFTDMEAKGKNCVIGRGNPRSNLCRILAAMAAQRNIPCHIVSPRDDDGTWTETNNSYLARMAGAVYHVCKEEEVPDTVRSVLDGCEAEGLSPYHLFGDASGRGNEAVPVRAYVKVYKEIEIQSKALKLTFDCISHASGNGMTLAGLLAGQALCEGKEYILGVSIAYQQQEHVQMIHRYLKAYFEDDRQETCPNVEIRITDQYLAGGYARHSDEIRNTIRTVYTKDGIALDPIYTGKAYAGLLNELKQEPGRFRNVLFIHTGGAPLFFDELSAWDVDVPATQMPLDA